MPASLDYSEDYSEDGWQTTVVTADISPFPPNLSLAKTRPSLDSGDNKQIVVVKDRVYLQIL